MQISTEQIRWFRLRRSGLVTPFAGPEAAATALAGVQAQILPAAALALWNRTSGLDYLHFEALLYEQRTLVKIWAQRGTLHLFASAEWPLIYAMLSERATWLERKVGRDGGDVAVYRANVHQIAELLRQSATLGRSDLRAAGLALDQEHLSSWGGIFADLVRKGYACHARPVNGEGRFAHREVWLPQLDWQPPSAAEAGAAIARRYLQTYGPATLADLAYWSGLPAAVVRGWLAAHGDEIDELSGAGQPLLMLRSDSADLHAAPPERDGWPVQLLYRFDPLLLGHKDKHWLVDAQYYNRVWRPAGHIEGTLLEHGRIAGVWRYDRAPRGLTIALQVFAPLADHVRAAVEAQAGAIAAFFGLQLADLQITTV